MAWKCQNCGTENEDGFDACWQCGTHSDGTPDRSFAREVDTATLPPDWVPRIKCGSCGYAGKVLRKHHGYQWWMIPLALIMSCTLIGIIPWVILYVLMGNATTKICPNCGSHDDLLDWDGAEIGFSPDAEEIWYAKQEEDLAAFATNKATLQIVLLIALVFAVVLMLSAMSKV